MSFICDDCGKPTKPGESCNKLVVETRPRVYIIRWSDKAGIVREKRSKGYEIVKELKLCEACFNERKSYNGRRRRRI